MMRKMIIGAIRLYQAGLSPLLPASCRFTPTCSDYAALAVERFGPWKGSLLSARRLLRCHPLGGKGFDPVPAEPVAPDSAPDDR
jgi:putative membrane protein insertion efficiency factor